MRRKILFGFLVICFVLFLSGLVATIEMNRLQRSMSGILSKKVEAITALHRLETIIEEQVGKLLYAAPSEKFDTLVIAADTKKIAERLQQLALLDTTIKTSYLETLLHSFEGKLKSAPMNTIEKDSLHTWYLENLYTLYSDIRRETDLLIDQSKNALRDASMNIEVGFYRSNMPAIIAVGIGIILVLLFNYFLRIYFVNPLLRIKDGIRSYLSHNIKYTVEVDNNDEMKELNDAVSELIERQRSTGTAKGNEV